MYRWFFNNVLARFDAEQTHRAAENLIRLAGSPAIRPFIAPIVGKAAPESSTVLFGRRLHNPLGIAAGFDKNATMTQGLFAMGFGFVEIGTVTAHSQEGNPRPRLFRVLDQKGLRNHMGFNNEGADVVAQRLKKLRSTGPGQRIVLGVNIGKSKITPAHLAPEDYAFSARVLARFADYLVVNVSSPNTPGLRDLQAVASLKPIVEAVQIEANHAAAKQVPVLVKIAPDLRDEDIIDVGLMVNSLGLSGVSAVNTTVTHTLGAGGVSGPILKRRGIEVVKLLKSVLEADKVIIGVGGIQNGQDVHDYLVAGADAVQAYTGFVYGGPRWVGATVNEAATL